MTKEFSEKEKSQRINHFRRVIRWRSRFGWIFSIVGLVLFFIGLKNQHNLMVLINGLLFMGYGIFMVWQSKKALAKFNANK